MKDKIDFPNVMLGLILVLIAFTLFSRYKPASSNPIDNISDVSIPQGSIIQCLNPEQNTGLPELSQKEKIVYAKDSYQICKYALAENSKKYSNNRWKNDSLMDLNNNYYKYNVTLTDVQETLNILENILTKGLLLANVQKEKDIEAKNKTQKEVKSIVRSYRPFRDYYRTQYGISVNDISE